MYAIVESRKPKKLAPTTTPEPNGAEGVWRAALPIKKMPHPSWGSTRSHALVFSHRGNAKLKKKGSNQIKSNQIKSSTWKDNQKQKSHGRAVVLHLRAQAGLSLLQIIPLGVQPFHAGGSRRPLSEEHRQRLAQGRSDVGEQVRRAERVPKGEE